jgi:hypothetical protein
MTDPPPAPAPVDVDARPPPQSPSWLADTVPEIVATPMTESLILPLKVPGTSNVPAVRLATSPVQVPVTVMVPDKLIVELPNPTAVTATPPLMDKLVPIKIIFPGIVRLVLIVQVVEKSPESHREFIVEKINSRVP